MIRCGRRTSNTSYILRRFHHHYGGTACTSTTFPALSLSLFIFLSSLCLLFFATSCFFFSLPILFVSLLVLPSPLNFSLFFSYMLLFLLFSSCHIYVFYVLSRLCSMFYSLWFGFVFQFFRFNFFFCILATSALGRMNESQQYQTARELCMVYLEWSWFEAAGHR